MRRRIGIYGATDEILQLIPLLASNPNVEIVALFDPDPERAKERLRALLPSQAETLERLFIDDFGTFIRGPLDAVIDSGIEPDLTARLPRSGEGTLQVVAPLTARLLWGYGVSTRDHKAELLQALREIVESYNLTIDADEICHRMLEIALGVTGADGGSLMLLDPESRELRIRVAVGIEPELWHKIRVPLGEGISGVVAATARPLRVRGKADRRAFHIVRERLDVESALCVPLIQDDKVLGVLNLHHSSESDSFSESDLEFAEQLAHFDAQIIARSQEHESLRNQASRYEAVREVRETLAGRAPLLERLSSLAASLAARAGRGIVNIYLYEPDADALRLSATSLEGGGLGGEYRVAVGQGIDGAVASSRRPSFLREPDGSLAYAAMPLIAGDSLVGVLSIQAGGERLRGRAAEETLLEIAAAAAEEIAQAEREARMATRSTKMSAINETGIRMLSTMDTAEVVRLATSSAAMILDADHAVLRLADEESGRYVIRSYYGSADGHLREELFRLDKRVCVDTIKRRAALRVRDVSSDERLQDIDTEIRSFLSSPLKSGGRVIGALAVYDKVAADHFYTESFNDEDLQTFTRFVSYVERAVANAEFHSRTRQHGNFDEETGLPNASYIHKRLHEEVARASGREGALAVAVCRVENLDEIVKAASGPHAHRVLRRTADALRSHLRDFDVVGRTAAPEFTVLLPDVGFSPGERVLAMARSVADDVSKDDALNDPVRVVLAFGYAIYPSEGSDSQALLERAGQARIRMV